MLLQDRVGRAEAPPVPVGEHLVLDGLRPVSPEGQDTRPGLCYILLRTETAVQPPQSGPLIWGFSNIVSGIGGRMPSA